jgi:hypothetical protein
MLIGRRILQSMCRGVEIGAMNDAMSNVVLVEHSKIAAQHNQGVNCRPSYLLSLHWLSALAFGVFALVSISCIIPSPRF